MSTAMKCMIAGATGLVGSELLTLLLSENRVEKIVAVGRRAPPGAAHTRLEPVVADFGKLDELDPPAADTAFCCLGTTLKKAGSREAFRQVDHDHVLAFGRLARRAGARTFVAVSALGADPKSLFFYNRVKGEAERDLAGLGFESLIIVRPSLILGERAEKRLAEGLAIRLAPLYRPLLVGPLSGQAPIEAGRIARSMLRIALESRAPGARVVLNGEMLRMTGE